MIQGRFGSLLMYLWATSSCFFRSSEAFVVHLSLYTTVQWGSVLQSILQHSRIKNRWRGKRQNNQNKPLERQVVEMRCSLFQRHYTRLLTYRKSLEIQVGKTVSPWITFSPRLRTHGYITIVKWIPLVYIQKKNIENSFSWLYIQSTFASFKANWVATSLSFGGIFITCTRIILTSAIQFRA